MKWILSLLGLWLTATTLPSPAQAADSVDSNRRILVMLKMPPDHYRPGSAYAGSYGAASTQAARNRIAVKIARRHGFRLIDNWPMPLLSVDCYVMVLPDGRAPSAEAELVSRDADVAWAQPLQLYQARASQPAGDPLFAAEPAAAQWHLAELHRIATGRGVSVAVIDSRIDTAHPDLAGQVTLSQDFVDGHGVAAERHGTAVAGVIAAREGNGGIVGLAPHARLMGLRACWQQSLTATLCDSLSLAKALQFAIAHRARIINMSLSGPRDILLGRLVDIGLARGQKVVAAFDPGAPDGGFPASQAGVIAVADENMSTPQRVLLAPGRDVPTTAPGGGWTLVDGTSYSAAHISGLLALMNERRPADAKLLVRARGGGVDACASLAAATHRCSCDCAAPHGPDADEPR